MLSRKHYYEIPGFENVYLEDSFVLNIHQDKSKIEFELDVVLTERHPSYTIPLEDEPYCYKHGHLIFSNVDKLHWEERSMRFSVDANGEVDYGNIDEFYMQNEIYYLSGDWGKITIKSSMPKIYFDSEGG